MPYYDKETIRAVSEIDLVTYLERADPDELVRQGAGRYTTKSHDSLTISNGKWCWYSRSIGGRNALTYLIKVKGLSFQEAVSELLHLGCQVPVAGPGMTKQEQRKLVLPPKTGDGENVKAYLRSRCIHPDVIKGQLESGAVYESAYTFKDSGKTRPQIVFLGFDERGEARYANIRGIGGGFKGDAIGSDKSYPFAIKPEIPTVTLRVFESAIDLLSFASIMRYRNSDYSAMHMISLGGVQPMGMERNLPIGLQRVLDTHPDIQRVALHLDNDTAGREAAAGIRAAIGKDYGITDAPPLKGKDYNDFLRLMYSGHNEPQSLHER